MLYASILLPLLYVSSILLRVLPNTLVKNVSSPDREFHYYYINLIKQHGHRCPEMDKRVLGGPNICDYPYFYHQMLSFFSKKVVDFIDKYGALIFDILSAGIIFIVLQQFKSSIGILDFFIIGAIYLLSPVFHMSIYAPRSFCITPRNFSQLLNVLTLSAIFLMLNTSGEVRFVFAGLLVLLISINLISSAFFLQVVFFIFIWSCLSQNWWVAFFCLSPFLTTFLLFLSRVRVQFKAHVDHSIWYLKYNRSFLISKNNFGALWRAIKTKDYEGLARELFINNGWTSFLLLNWVQVLFLLKFMHYNQELPEFIHVAVKLNYMLLFSWFVTSLGFFKILGESERYLQYGFPFALISILYVNYSVVFVLLAHAVLLYLLNLVFIFVSKSRSPHKFLLEVLGRLNQKDNTNVLCLDQRDRYSVLLHTKHNMVGMFVKFKFLKGARLFYEYFFKFYPFVNLDNLLNIVQKYEVQYLIYNKYTLEDFQKKESEYYDVSCFESIYENEKYILYRLIQGK